MTTVLLGLCVLAITTAEPVVLRGHTSGVMAAVFSADGKQIASGGMDRTVRVWDVAGKAPARTLDTCSAWVRGAAFSPDGQLLVVAAGHERTGEVVGYDLATGAVRWRRPTSPDPACAVAFDRDGQAVVAVANLGVLVLDPDGTEVGRFHAPPHWPSSPALSADGRRLVTADLDGRVKFWDYPARKDLGTFTYDAPGKRAISAVAFSPDGQTAAATCGDGQVRFGDAGTFLMHTELVAHRNPVNSVAFSPDGRELATAGYREAEVRRWRAAWLQPAGKLRGHDETVYCVRFSPDGCTLLTASDDGTVRLWPAGSP